MFRIQNFVVVFLVQITLRLASRRAIKQEHASEDPKRVEKEVKRYKGMREHQRYAERINTAKEVLQEALARPEPFSPNAFGYT